MLNFFVALLICSATMSAVALFYMAITPLLAKRYSAKWRYYAWLVIVIGLLIPFRPHFDTAIITVDVSTEIMPVTQGWNGTPNITMLNEDNTPSAPTLRSVSWEQIAMAIWLAGVISVFFYHAIRHYRFMRMVDRWSKEVTDVRSCGILRKLTDQMGMPQTVKVQECSCIPVPMMIGFLSPVILLPKADFSEDELSFILKHELVHWGRKDLWYKCLVLATTAIHWFNPVVYLMSKEISAQCELSCDEKVLLSKPADARQQYCETIIGMIRNQCKVKTALSTNFYGGKKSMKKRIFSIMDTTKKKTGFAIICGALIVTLGTSFAFAVNTTAALIDATPYVGDTAVADASSSELYAKSFEIYEDYGLSYDKATFNLYYKGELVRYFGDIYPVGEDEYAGFDLFNANGTIDIHGVRDFSQTTYNSDGSYDPSGKLIGVEPYSEAAPDASYTNPQSPQQNNSSITTNATTVDANKNQQNKQGRTLAEIFADYKDYGIEFDHNTKRMGIGNVYYQGRLVETFIDEKSDGGIFSYSSTDGGEIIVRTVYDGNGKLAGVEVAGE